MIFRVGLAALLLGCTICAADAEPANNLNELRRALVGCWIWPPLDEAVEGMEVTVLFSLTRDGVVFGEPKFTYFKQGLAPEAMAAYQKAAAESLVRCTPVSITPALGNAIAGRPIGWRFKETRIARKI